MRLDQRFPRSESYLVWIERKNIAYNVLIFLRPWMQSPRLYALWEKLWKRGLDTFFGSVKTWVHGRMVVVNYGYTYPIYARQHPDLNAPLLQLAYQTWKSKGSKIRFADVGAAVGDTVLLLYANLPEAFDGFICVDGDTEFFQYLTQNLSHLPSGNLVLGILSSAEESTPNLVRTHSGTASAQGTTRIASTTLTKVLNDSVDLLKIDVDGFDGEVLAGAEEVLLKYLPTVIFEWHPILCQQTGNSWSNSFHVLQKCGYSRYLWYTKFGTFSHFMFEYDAMAVDSLAKYCLGNIPLDWHYDVVALHDSSALDIIALASLEFAKNRSSRF